MVLTDFFRRGVPWASLLLRERSGTQVLNLGWRHRLSALACMVFVAAVPARRVRLAFWSAAAFVALNRSFYALLFRRRGGHVASIGIGLHALHHLPDVVALESKGARPGGGSLPERPMLGSRRPKLLDAAGARLGLVEVGPVLQERLDLVDHRGRRGGARRVAGEAFPAAAVAAGGGAGCQWGSEVGWRSRSARQNTTTWCSRSLPFHGPRSRRRAARVAGDGHGAPAVQAEPAIPCCSTPVHEGCHVSRPARVVELLDQGRLAAAEPHHLEDHLRRARSP